MHELGDDLNLPGVCDGARTRAPAKRMPRAPPSRAESRRPRSGLPNLPDVFAREIACPLEGREIVGGRGVRVGPELDQVLHKEAGAAEQADPLAVGELPLDGTPVG